MTVVPVHALDRTDMNQLGPNLKAEAETDHVEVLSATNRAIFNDRKWQAPEAKLNTSN